MNKKGKNTRNLFDLNINWVVISRDLSLVTICQSLNLHAYPFHLLTASVIQSDPRAPLISASVFPIPTAISTRAFEIASLLPSCMSSGVIGIPNF